MIRIGSAVGVALAATVAVTPVAAQDTLQATAELVDSAGNRVGEVTLREAPGNGVILDIRVRGLSEGVHAVHIHETGRCEPPSFDSAGGHYAPQGSQHGFLHAGGAHGGDLPNLHVPASGELVTERLAAGVTLKEGEPNSLFDADGSAIVIHAAADDYETQPSGDSGDPIICGVVRPVG